MFRVLMADGTVKELPQVVTAAIENRRLICRDAKGAIVQRFEQLGVLAYGMSDAFDLLEEATAGLKPD
jgi:hypothetical protein